MGWKIEIRELDGTFKPRDTVYTDKVRADVAMRREIFNVYGKTWVTPTLNGTQLHSSTHSIVLGRMHEVTTTFSEDAINKELQRRLREYHASNSG